MSPGALQQSAAPWLGSRHTQKRRRLLRVQPAAVAVEAATARELAELDLVPFINLQVPLRASECLCARSTTDKSSIKTLLQQPLSRLLAT